MPGSPLVIGGAGGSGTRVVARIVARGGCFLGQHRNGSEDAVPLGEFDWIWGLRYLQGQVTKQMIEAFDQAVARHLGDRRSSLGVWGWKHTHSYLLIPFLLDRFPELRFIHVIRDGRDVALSENQRQLGRYGELALGPGLDTDVERRLRFWGWANCRAANEGEALLGERYMRVRLEDLDADPLGTARALLEFSEGSNDNDVTSLISSPAGLGRGAAISVPPALRPILERFDYRSAPGPKPKPSTDIPGWIAAEVRAGLPTSPRRVEWPSVSIVVPTFNGHALLQRLMQGLRELTDYPNFEVVVVDNASSDATIEWLGNEGFPFPVRLVCNPRNFSFSAACNAGAGATSGELLLFLNNDVEPIEGSWLRRLVACLDDCKAAVAGAVLVDPDRVSSGGRIGAVQHHGISFEHRTGALRPGLRGLGSELFEALGPDLEVPAVAAACALIRRSDFAAAGEFCERFHYGGEDVDLCLRTIVNGGKVVVSGSTVLLHRPLSTRRHSPEVGQATTRANHRLLLQRWGPGLRRELAIDSSAGGGGNWTLRADPGPDLGAGAHFCVKAGPDVPSEAAEALVAGIAATGSTARSDDGSDAWLLADVVVHLHDGRGRFALLPGRCNLLVLTGSGNPPVEAHHFDAVVTANASAADIVCEALAEMEARGGPPRIAPPASRSPGSPASIRAADRSRDAIIVLGMARTGTSAVARVLNLLGVELGAEHALLGPIEGVNDKGFYEHYEIMRLNTELLKRRGGTWRQPPPLPDGWHEDPDLDDLRERASCLLHRDFGSAPLWGFKDPRTCLTLPFWRPFLGSPRFIICHRNPLEVAASLERRDQLSAAESVALWREYIARAVVETADDPRMFVSYRDLLEGGSGPVSEIAGFIGRRKRSAEPSVKEAIVQWIDDAQRHHAFSLQQVMADETLTAEDKALVLLLELAVKRGPLPIAGRRADDGEVDALVAAAGAALTTRTQPEESQDTA